jgi:hypothetical protein
MEYKHMGLEWEEEEKFRGRRKRKKIIKVL